MFFNYYFFTITPLEKGRHDPRSPFSDFQPLFKQMGPLIITPTPTTHDTPPSPDIVPIHNALPLWPSLHGHDGSPLEPFPLTEANGNLMQMSIASPSSASPWIPRLFRRSELRQCWPLQTRPDGLTSLPLSVPALSGPRERSSGVYTRARTALTRRRGS